MPDMPSDSDDIRHNPSAKLHRVLPNDFEPTPSGDDEAAKKLAQELLKEHLKGLDLPKEQSAHLWKEPEHPLVAACESWAQAIQKHDPIQAALDARRVVELMPMYERRPAFKLLYDKLHLSQLLASENLAILRKLVDVARG